MRQFGKQNLTIFHRSVSHFVFAAGVALAAWVFLPSPTSLAQTRLYSVDPLSGLAINGYDPVSYFTEGRPQLGDRAYEYFWDGISWLFASEGNRDAFSAHPEIYVPQFGGHGAMSVARGYLSAGDPNIYEVRDDQLFLFHSAGNKQAFDAAPNTARIRAMENWSDLRPTLISN